MELAQVHEEVSSRTGSTLEESAGLLVGGAGAGAGGVGTIWAQHVNVLINFEVIHFINS